ncbi:MAG: ABC transporter permease [Planctomycetota bacterium]
MKGGEIIKEARLPASKQLRECAAALFLYPSLVIKNREIIRNFYSRELRSRFRGTVLGWAWPFVMPLVLFLVYYFVFAELLQAKFGVAGVADAEGKSWFTVYLFVGVVVWSGFAESVTRNCSIILENSNLIKKIAFPSEILPLNTILVSLTIQGIAIAAYLLLSPLLGWNAFSPYLAALPILFIIQAALSLGLSLASASANVFVRDTQPILGIVMTFWQFATPVFWSTSVISKETLDRYQWALDANPMYHLLEGYRKVLVNPGLKQDGSAELQKMAPMEWPWAECQNVLITSLAFFIVGYSLFYISKRRFSDEL